MIKPENSKTADEVASMPIEEFLVWWNAAVDAGEPLKITFKDKDVRSEDGRVDAEA